MLDVACGPGYAAGQAAARGATVIGIDFARAMVTEAHHNFPRVEFRQGDAHALPFDAGSFDAVICNFGVLHFAEPNTALAEAYRVLVMDTQDSAPQFLLIVRERLRRGMEEAYGKNELKIAAACATLKCPHPYLALAPVAGPKEVWWLNAFASQEEKNQLESAYARNEPLMGKLRPLGKRKEGFREALTTTFMEYRPDLSGGAALRLVGARFLVININQDEREAAGAVFESSDGERFVVASADSHAAAERIALRAGPRSIMLAVQPQWSFPADAWIAADPVFWSSNPVARNRRASPGSL